MNTTLHTRGHRLSPVVVRILGGAIVAGLAASFIAASRVGGLVSVVALAIYAGWVGMGQSRYVLTDHSLVFHSVLGSTTLEREQVRDVAWERDELNIAELTIRGDFGRAISVTRADLDANVEFERDLNAFLASAQTNVIRVTSKASRSGSSETVLSLAG